MDVALHTAKLQKTRAEVIVLNVEIVLVAHRRAFDQPRAVARINEASPQADKTKDVWQPEAWVVLKVRLPLP